MVGSLRVREAGEELGQISGMVIQKVGKLFKPKGIVADSLGEKSV